MSAAPFTDSTGPSARAQPIAMIAGGVAGGLAVRPNSGGRVSKPVVLLDVDEVLVDFVGRALDEIRDITGRDAFRADVKCWDIDAAIGLTPEEAAEKKRRIAQPGFCSSLEPIVGAIGGVRELREMGYDVRAVTSPFPSKTWANEREEMLCDVFSFNRREVVQTSGKDIVFGDVLVDDKLETCIEWQARWKTSTAILFSAPWNRDRGWTGEYTNGWAHVEPNGLVWPRLTHLIKRCCP